jgi:hypothetical protein
VTMAGNSPATTRSRSSFSDPSIDGRKVSQGDDQAIDIARVSG